MKLLLPEVAKERQSQRRSALKVRAHVLVSGRVQGVFFRQEIQERASRLNVSGWVRNTHDGRVEVVFEGEKKNVERLIEFCRRGPAYAHVTKTEVTWKDYLGEFEDFRIRY